MVKKFLFVVILIVLSVIGYSQKKLYEIEQVLGKEKYISEFMYNAGMKKQYTFAVLLPLGGCPRCEGCIPLFFKQAKEAFPNENHLLMVLHQNEEAAFNFLRDKDYGASHIAVIDYDSKFLEALHFATTTVGVPFLLIIDNENGYITNATSTLGLNYSQQYFDEFSSNIQNSRIPVFEIPTATDSSQIKEITSSNMFDKNNIELEIKQNTAVNVDVIQIPGIDTLVSSIMAFFVKEDLSAIGMIDYLTKKVAIVTSENGNYRIKRVFSTKEDEFQMFKADNVPIELYEYLKQINLLNVFYLDLSIIGDDDVYLTTSLPELYWENIETESLAYKNKACLMHIELEENLENRTYIEIPENESAIFSHSNFFMDSRKHCFFPAQKGWPVIGSSDRPENDEENPFVESFYDNCPDIVEYESNGVFCRTIGILADWHKQNRTGYFYHKPIVRFTDNDIMVIDPYISNITIYDYETAQTKNTVNLNKTIEIQQDENYLEHLQSGSMLDVIKSKGQDLKWRIIDATKKGNNYYAIVRSSERTLILKMDDNLEIADSVIELELGDSDATDMRLLPSDGLSIVGYDNNPKGVRFFKQTNLEGLFCSE